MHRSRRILPDVIRTASAIMVVLALLLLPLVEFRSGFFLGNLHPGMDQFFIFSGRWSSDVACIAAAMAALLAWRRAERRPALATALLFASVALPFTGNAWLEHVDSIVSYPPGYFTGD